MSIINSIDVSEFEPLTRLKNPPKKLYYRGNLEYLKRRKVSIVGSRKMSIYTKQLILNLSNALARNRICVVSGGAIGCDSAAHKGAFPNTIAVFANGLDEIYPKVNSQLIKEIYKNSLALSEYPQGVKAYKHQFLERNRIVVSLSEALVVAQADLRSGSLASAKVAQEIGIPVYVLPHRMDESRGTNELLANKKAILIDDIDKFVSKFIDLEIKSENDDMLNFIKSNSNFNEIYNKFGDLLYEYELDGKIEILGTKVVVK
ncbi:MAG: DNA-processing protein DprA [Campylobacter sp.]|nr:DNA-processing protein DprA [Campylobacter sp.]